MNKISCGSSKNASGIIVDSQNPFGSIVLTSSFFFYKIVLLKQFLALPFVQQTQNFVKPEDHKLPPTEDKDVSFVQNNDETVMALITSFLNLL